MSKSNRRRMMTRSKSTRFPFSEEALLAGLDAFTAHADELAVGIESEVDTDQILEQFIDQE